MDSHLVAPKVSVPCNKGRLVRQKAPLKPKKSGQSVSVCSWRARCEIEPSSTLLSIVGCAAVTWLVCESVPLHRAEASSGTC